MFGVGWNGLPHWNDDAVSFTVGGSCATPTTTIRRRPPRRRRPRHRRRRRRPRHRRRPHHTTTAPPTTVPRRWFFSVPTQTVGFCSGCRARRVRGTRARRGGDPPGQQVLDQDRGQVNPVGRDLRGVTGIFTGTTDDIIQWASCKWGIDEDIIRAPTAKCPGGSTHRRRLPRPFRRAAQPGHGSGSAAPGGVPRVRRRPAGPLPVLAEGLSVAHFRRPTSSTTASPCGAAASRAPRRASTKLNAGGSTSPATCGAVSAAGSPAAGTPAVRDLHRRGPGLPAATHLDEAGVHRLHGLS